jgi:hypothetical protein
MLEMGTSGWMSGEGKPSAACRSRLSALPRLYAWPENRADARMAVVTVLLIISSTTRRAGEVKQIC